LPRQLAPMQTKVTADTLRGWLARAPRLRPMSVVRPGRSVDAATLAAAHSDHDAGSLVQVAKFGEDEANRFGTAEPSPQTTPT
jgi:hypothetical protein